MAPKTPATYSYDSILFNTIIFNRFNTVYLNVDCIALGSDSYFTILAEDDVSTTEAYRRPKTAAHLSTISTALTKVVMLCTSLK